jgi:hypothetical protein
VICESVKALEQIAILFALFELERFDPLTPKNLLYVSSFSLSGSLHQHPHHFHHKHHLHHLHHTDFRLSPIASGASCAAIIRAFCSCVAMEDGFYTGDAHEREANAEAWIFRQQEGEGSRGRNKRSSMFLRPSRKIKSRRRHLDSERS